MTSRTVWAWAAEDVAARAGVDVEQVRRALDAAVADGEVLRIESGGRVRYAVPADEGLS